MRAFGTEPCAGRCVPEFPGERECRTAGKNRPPGATPCPRGPVLGGTPGWSRSIFARGAGVGGPGWRPPAFQVQKPLEPRPNAPLSNATRHCHKPESRERSRSVVSQAQRPAIHTPRTLPNPVPISHLAQECISCSSSVELHCVVTPSTGPPCFSWHTSAIRHAALVASAPPGFPARDVLPADSARFHCAGALLTAHDCASAQVRAAIQDSRLVQRTLRHRHRRHAPADGRRRTPQVFCAGGR